MIKITSVSSKVWGDSFAFRVRGMILCWLVFLLLVVANGLFWTHSRPMRTAWDNVPLAPSASRGAFAGIGDREMLYRMYGYFLQNLGNSGGRFQPLKSYDYALLEDWFRLGDVMDERSNYIPFLARYYFGAVEDDPARTAHVRAYLADHGHFPYPQKWRWLAGAVYLAQYNEKNLPLALSLARELASLPASMPSWAVQMPAFVQLEMGNKQAAYEIMLKMLISGVDTMDPAEINFMTDFICTRTIPVEEMGQNKVLCSAKKPDDKAHHDDKRR